MGGIKIIDVVGMRRNVDLIVLMLHKVIFLERKEPILERVRKTNSQQMRIVTDPR